MSSTLPRLIMRSIGRPLGPLASGAARSMHPLKDAVPAHFPRPLPDLPGRRIVADREEDDLASADQVLKRHVTDTALVRGQPRIARIVPVVAHHEVMSGRHFVDPRIVERAF